MRVQAERRGEIVRRTRKDNSNPISNASALRRRRIDSQKYQICLLKVPWNIQKVQNTAKPPQYCTEFSGCSTPVCRAENDFRFGIYPLLTLAMNAYPPHALRSWIFRCSISPPLPVQSLGPGFESPRKCFCPTCYKGGQPRNDIAQSFHVGPQGTRQKMEI